MDLDSLVITESWLIGNVSDQKKPTHLAYLMYKSGLKHQSSSSSSSDEKIVGDETPPGYSFHHAARIHKKGGEVGILLRDSLKCETHLRFQAKSFENYQLTFISYTFTPH